MNDMIEKFLPANILAEFSGILVILLILSVGFWFLIGRFKLHNLLINIYISFAIMQVVSKETASLGIFAPLIIFMGLVIFLTAIDSNIFEIHLSGSGLRIWQVIILSFLEAGLLFSIISSLLPQKQLLRFVSSESIGYFILPWASIFWIVAPIVFLILISGKRK